ncbi:MAG TPA: RNB domain-containing ribonuclease, partial [Burkholderiales bacterium]|nr:RNB domain-containing ribonuclease [Burkholderiales bacterium]
MSTKKRADRRALDPHRDREAARYENPIASREFILQTLAQAGVPLTDAELAQRLAIEPGERDAFERRLAAMEREAEILRNRKGAILVATKLHLVTGRVEGHPDGYGFVLPDEGGDLYLGPHEMRRVLHGDRVMVRESGIDRRGRKEAKIVEVIERVNARVVGRLRREHGVLLVQPSERRISQNILVAADDASGARAGQVVVAEISAQPDGHTQPIGRIVEVLGEAADPGIEIEIALRKHDLPFRFSAGAEQLAAKFPDAPRAGDLAGREDLRALDLVTIDGETARDFDDAVYCEKTREGFRLVVAIADVSHYVRDGDALDLEARERGNSVYFPRRVIPMLPERLSNGLCSLNAEVDRLCMACDMAIGARGEIGRYRFYPAIMRSRARLTYTAVAAALADPKGEAGAKLKGLLQRLQL